MRGVTVRESGRSVIARNRFCEVSVNLDIGTWSALDRAAGKIVFKDAQFCIDSPVEWSPPRTRVTWRKRDRRTSHGTATELTLTFRPMEGYYPTRKLVIRLYPGSHFIEIGWGVKNPFKYPIRIREVDLVRNGEMFVGQRVTHPRVLKSGAGAEPNVFVKGWQLEALNGAILTYRDGGDRRSIVAGGLHYREYARRVSFIDSRKRGGARKRQSGHRTMKLTAWDPQGKRIEPGATYMSADTVYLDFITQDPFKALEAYGEAMRLANHANPNTYDFPTLCGWMVSTSYLGEGKPINNSPGLVEQTEIARNRGLMKYTPLAVRLEPDTYCYGNQGNTQQGWWDNAHWAHYGPGNGAGGGKCNGSLRKPYETFAKFCRAVLKRGGIPFTYFQCSMPSNDFAIAHPEWMLNRDISLIHTTHRHHRPLVRYDYSEPGFRKHCLSVWKRLRKAGLKGVKFDYPETAWASQGGFSDTAFTTTSAYRELYRLCREGLGDDAFLHERNLGGTTHEDAPRLDVTAGIVDIQRVWGDASHFEPEMASRIGLRWYKSRKVFLYYPDGKSFYENGKELPAYKRRAFLTLIAFLSGRLEIGTSIGSMTDEMFKDVTRLYPVFGGTRSPRPVDMLSGGIHPSIYVYKVTSDWHQVLLINNRRSRSSEISAPLSGDSAETGAVGLEPDCSYHAFEFWSQEYLGRLKGTGAVSRRLRGGEVAMISMRRARSRPQVISTNRHIMQGLVETHNIHWDGRRGALSGSVDILGGEDLVITVACNGFRPDTCEGAALRKRARGLVDLVFTSQENATGHFSVRFKKA